MELKNQKSISVPVAKDAQRTAFTLIELVVVISVISFFVFLAMANITGLLKKGSFEAQLHNFASTMEMAAKAAAESDRRYEVIIDLSEQNYLLRQITTTDLSEVLDEEIIVQNEFSNACWVSYVEYDDGDYANEGQVKFRAGHAGWQYGAKIVFLDESDLPYTIVVNRINRIVELKKGDVALLLPRDKDEMLF